jgi:hypothetical protein
MKTLLSRLAPLEHWRRFRAYEEWRSRDFDAPSPSFVKRARLLKNGIPRATWVETGTYLGDTTDVLSRNASHVYSIEPEPSLYRSAVKRFVGRTNVTILNGTSEDVFPTLLPKLAGDVCFWLDGHFSGEGTHRGPNDTPITRELEVISQYLPHFGAVVVMVDDVRHFTGKVHSYGSYPNLESVGNWATLNGLAWTVEHDMLVAKRA